MNDQFDDWHEDAVVSLDDVSSNIDETNDLLKELRTKIDGIGSTLSVGVIVIVILLVAHVGRHW